MKTSRQQVLDYIRAQRAVSAGDLSRALQMTEANARHHLKILSEEGLIAEVGKRSQESKGRPLRLYGLSEQAAGNNLGSLASALLDEIFNLKEGQIIDENKTEILDRLAARILHQSLDNPLDSLTSETHLHSARLAQRLYQAVRWLNGHHYDARWEAHALAPRLILAHCPYLDILAGHPELCLLDRNLLEGLIDAPVEQIARLQLVRSGGRQCVFVVQKP
ncbi:MAG: transcriptional regulator [Chloroflexi bacterium]|jgi:predicted ArsR family transcriptional regulator|nr:transcriptional regulator [Chloroflexota bacterium]